MDRRFESVTYHRARLSLAFGKSHEKRILKIFHAAMSVSEQHAPEREMTTRAGRGVNHLCSDHDTFVSRLRLRAIGKKRRSHISGTRFPYEYNYGSKENANNRAYNWNLPELKSSLDPMSQSHQIGSTSAAFSIYDRLHITGGCILPSTPIFGGFVPREVSGAVTLLWVLCSERYKGLWRREGSERYSAFRRTSCLLGRIGWEPSVST